MAQARTVRNEEDAKFYSISTRLMMLEALSKGYEVEFYPSSPSTHSGIVRVSKKGKEAFFKSTTISATPSYGVFASSNKALTQSLLEAKEIPTPITMVLAATDAPSMAHDMLEEFTQLVVKPAAMDHGDGVTIGVTTKKDLEKAITFARDTSNHADADVLVQQQVSGEEFRFLVVDGKVVAVAGRRPPTVVGNGHSTVAELIAEKNKDPRRGNKHSSELTLISVDDVIHHRGPAFMKKVLKKGEQAQLLDTSNLSRGGEAIDYTDTASKELKQLAVLAAEACFLKVGGIDIMTNDITTSELDSTYIIETNLEPGIRMHMFPSEGKPRNVAKIIFQAVEKRAQKTNIRVTPVGRSEKVALPEYNLKAIPARIDTGATVSAIWASSIKETPEGLSFVLFDKKSPYYTGEVLTTKTYGKRTVASSMGHTEVRHQLQMLVGIHGRRIRAIMTLADRSKQTYPILIGRNVLRNKFTVDVASGKPLRGKERIRRKELDQPVKGE